MKRRKKKKYVRILIVLFIYFILLSSSYAYLSTELKIGGNATASYTTDSYTIDPSGNVNLSIQDFSLTRWQENNLNKYHYTFKLKNNGTEIYDNYKITITFSEKIESVSIWNNSCTINNNVVVVTNNSIHLNPNETVEIGLIVSSYSPYLNLVKFKLESTTETHEIDPSKFLVVFTKTGGWGNYTYQYDVKLTNKTGVTVNYWELNITLPTETSYLAGWNSKFTTAGNILTAKNETHNGKIENDKSVSFGLQLNTNILNYIPSNIKVVIR